MTPAAELGDPSKAAGEGMIAAPAHLSQSELQPTQGRNQPQKGEGGVGEVDIERARRKKGRHGSRKGRGKKAGKEQKGTEADEV